MWMVFLLMAGIIPGFHLQSNDEAVSYSEGQIYRPALEPSESTPTTGTYTLTNAVGKPCIKVTMGAQFIIYEKKTWYFSLDPSTISTSGHCDKEAAVLSLVLPDFAAHLQLTFRKEKYVFYITMLTAHLSPLPFCQKCANKTYLGLLAHGRWFTTVNGRTYRCKSENLLKMSPELKLRLVPLQIQAFALPTVHDGKDVECMADINKRVIPIVLVATAVGLCLTSVLTCLFIRDRQRRDYDQF